MISTSNRQHALPNTENTTFEILKNCIILYFLNKKKLENVYPTGSNFLSMCRHKPTYTEEKLNILRNLF